MTHRAVSTALSFGQLFLFQETAPKRPVLYRPSKKRTGSLRLKLRNVALAGLLFGFAASVLVQSLWLHACR